MDADANQQLVVLFYEEVRSSGKVGFAALTAGTLQSRL